LGDLNERILSASRFEGQKHNSKVLAELPPFEGHELFHSSPLTAGGLQSLAILGSQKKHLDLYLHVHKVWGRSTHVSPLYKYTSPVGLRTTHFSPLSSIKTLSQITSYSEELRVTSLGGEETTIQPIRDKHRGKPKAKTN
jgi:hypothetical protein